MLCCFFLQIHGVVVVVVVVVAAMFVTCICIYIYRGLYLFSKRMAA